MWKFHPSVNPCLAWGCVLPESLFLSPKYRNVSQSQQNQLILLVLGFTNLMPCCQRINQAFTSQCLSCSFLSFYFIWTLACQGFLSLLKVRDLLQLNFPEIIYNITLQPVCMYCFLFFHLGCKFSQVSAGSSAKPWMPLDSQQPNSHCYWLTTYSELLCVCSHSHLHWYETAQTQELGRGRPQAQWSQSAGRQAVQAGTTHLFSLIFSWRHLLLSVKNSFMCSC